MSLTIFLALCILGVDFLIYVLLHWTFGDKRKAISRQLAEHKASFQESSARPFLVASRRAARGLPSHWSAGTSRSRPQLTLASQSRS
jgi:hypothetical protein